MRQGHVEADLFIVAGARLAKGSTQVGWRALPLFGVGGGFLLYGVPACSLAQGRCGRIHTSKRACLIPLSAAGGGLHDPLSIVRPWAGVCFVVEGGCQHRLAPQQASCGARRRAAPIGSQAPAQIGFCSDTRASSF